jgi:hypothetical protein
MNTTISNLSVWRTWRESKLTTVLAVCEDNETIVRVIDFCRDLHNQLGQSCKDAKAVWLFTQLRVPRLRQIAADEAAVNDLVIISAHNTDALPEEVQKWIELWVEQEPNRSTVLLALLDHAHDGPTSALRSYLKETARRGHMDLVIELTE